MKNIILILLTTYSIHAGDLVHAIHMVESSGRTGKNIIGDNGKAIGPLQIHKVCWIDALQYDKSIKGSYQDCHDLKYAKRVFNAYIKRYGKGKTIEQKARIWNGGPKGYKKRATVKYWLKVKKHL